MAIGCRLALRKGVTLIDMALWMQGKVLAAEESSASILMGVSDGTSRAQKGRVEWRSSGSQATVLSHLRDAL